MTANDDELYSRVDYIEDYSVVPGDELYSRVDYIEDYSVVPGVVQ